MWVSTIFPLHFPVPLSSVGSFATTNNIPINVYGGDDKKVIYPLCVPSTLVPDRYLDLLLFECNVIQHYTTIRNFSRLGGLSMLFIVASSVYTLTKHKELLDSHATDGCHTQRTKFPDDPRCQFTNIQLPVPFVVYAD